MWKGEVVITKLLFVIPGTCYDAADTVLVGTKHDRLFCRCNTSRFCSIFDG